MPHLVETYGLATGLRINKMQTYEQFFPLPDGFDKYILICTGSGMPAKNYSYFADVLWMMRDALKKNGYKVIQIGGPEDERIGADLDICGGTSRYQYYYLVKNASLVICNDSSILHLAGHYNVKVVSLFGMTDPKVSGAYFGAAYNQTHLVPEYATGGPSFNPNERPKTVDRILPEKAAASALAYLYLKGDVVETVYLGEQYRFQAIEVVPDHLIDPSNFTKSMLNIRFDYGGEEQICYAYLSQRKCNLITNKPLNIDALVQLRPNIANIVYEINENHDPKFVEAMHRVGVPYVLVSFMPEEELLKLRLDYFEFNLINSKLKKTRDQIPNIEKVTSETRFRSNKYILSDGKIYLSRAHLEAKSPIPSFEKNDAQVIDSDEFWKEVDFFYLFNRKALKD